MTGFSRTPTSRISSRLLPNVPVPVGLRRIIRIVDGLPWVR
jgi:hypothetical protein